MNLNLNLEEENLSDCLDELKPLLAKHYLEVAAYQDKIALDPDYDRYLQMEKMDLTRTFVLRADGAVVGYWVFFLTPHPHYKQDRYAVNDIVYVEPEYRTPGITPRCFQAVEDALVASGASVITYHMKTYKPFERMLSSMGYDHLEALYGKCVKK